MVGLVSDETLRRLDEAIAEHIRDEAPDDGGGRIVTGWVLYASSVSGADMERGVTTYTHECPSDQPAHASIGLAEMLRRELGQVQWEDEHG